MALNPPTAGLRPIFNRSKQPAKVSLIIAPGDTLAVSDDLAEQLIAASSALTDLVDTTADETAETATVDGDDSSMPAENVDSGDSSADHAGEDAEANAAPRTTRKKR